MRECFLPPAPEAGLETSPGEAAYSWGRKWGCTATGVKGRGWGWKSARGSGCGTCSAVGYLLHPESSLRPTVGGVGRNGSWAEHCWALAWRCNIQNIPQGFFLYLRKRKISIFFIWGTLNIHPLPSHPTPSRRPSAHEQSSEITYRSLCFSHTLT